VALSDLVLIVKTGFMTGAMGGGRVTSFDYQDIVSIEENTGMAFATIEILTAAYSPR